jgi:hypothetical protein
VPVTANEAGAMRLPAVKVRFPLGNLLIVCALPVGLLALSQFGLFPWSGVNCSQDDVDIQSGRIRHTRYLLWFPVNQIVADSALTKELSAEDRTGKRAEWHPVMTLSPGLHHSPHYVFHGAISDIRELELCWDFGRFTPMARAASARRVLQLWQQSGSDSQARKYIQAIATMALDAENRGGTIDEGDLPLP